MAERVDCAIVGGGVAGLYAAWRLTSPLATSPQRDQPRVMVFEQNDRLGGRIDTVPVGNSTSRVEMGAMRFWKAQQLVSAVLTELQISIEEFPGEQELSCYLRGVQLRPAHFAQPANVPFRLQGAEVGKDVAALLQYALLRIAPELGGPMTQAQIDALAERPDLATIGFWNALQGVLSSEAYQLLQSGMGERSAFSNWHAGEAVRLMAFIGRASQTPLYRPTGGFTSLIEALNTSLRSRGTAVATGRRLLTMEPGPDGAASIALTFEAADTGKSEQYVARQVILALPKRALDAVLQRSHVGLSSQPRVQALLDSVDVFSAFKLYASYATPWWTLGWGAHGYSVTDLPIRQVYYGVGVGGTDADNSRVLMASYADALPAQFWGPLLREAGTSAGPRADLPPVVAQVMDQLSEVHSLRDLPEPEWWSARDWGAEGGAWHAWRAGVSVPSTMTTIRRPFPDLPVFVCGEAFSRMQGWIEGALMSVEKTLESSPFNLSRPAWIPADYDLGP